MSINSTIAALQALHATISGVSSAPLPVAYPERLHAAALPLVLVWPLPGRWSLEAAGGLRRQERHYRVQVYVQLATPKSAIGAAMDPCAALLQRFGEAYSDPAKLVLATGVTLDTSDVSDAGVELLTYGGGTAYGFAFKVAVYENW